LQPSCSPKKLTLLPTTGPRSSRIGVSRDVSDDRNLRSALVAKTGSSAAADAPWARGSDSGFRCAMRSNSPTIGFGVRRSAFRVLRSMVLVLVLVLVPVPVLGLRSEEPRTQNPEPRTRNQEP